jgi:cyclopropane fatty-acyl-phospholipid synthase-like methyltransferase
MRPSEKWILSTERAAQDGQLAYQSWFDRADSLDATRSQACVDFFCKIMTADVLARIGSPHDQTALEIGSGGGRLLGCAAQCFSRSIGVDIVYQSESFTSMSRELLAVWGVSDKCDLIPPESLTQVTDSSVGFVYSYIVFQHMDSVATVWEYLKQIRRVLRTGGVARLFFGMAEFSHAVSAGEFDPNNLFFSSSLKISVIDFLEMSRVAGFQVLNQQTVVMKQPWSDMQSTQAMCDLTVG